MIVNLNSHSTLIEINLEIYMLFFVFLKTLKFLFIYFFFEKLLFIIDKFTMIIKEEGIRLISLLI